MRTGGKLIYDIGANDGADTAYYLQQGFSVVAIEADPSLCDVLRARFADEITRGMVIVVNAAVMEEDRDATALYVSEDNTESSLIRSMAERAGPAARQLLVRGRCLCSLFSEYGLPWYCKIDIEGYDASAVNGMSGCGGRPVYISCEGAGRPIGEIYEDERLLYHVLDALSAQGYREFKLVDQERLLVLADAGHYDRLHSWPGRLKARLERMVGRGVADSVSGPFGEQLAGEWADYSVTRRRMKLHFSHYYQYTKNKQFIFWVDIHGKC